MRAVAPHARMHTDTAVIVAVPIRVERVVTHHETHRVTGALVIDQHHLLVMRRLSRHRGSIGILGSGAAPGVAALSPRAPRDFRSFRQCEVACGKFDIVQGLIVQRVTADGRGKMAGHRPRIQER
jgi:hypothetical protein